MTGTMVCIQTQQLCSPQAPLCVKIRAAATLWEWVINGGFSKSYLPDSIMGYFQIRSGGRHRVIKKNSIWLSHFSSQGCKYRNFVSGSSRQVCSRCLFDFAPYQSKYTPSLTSQARDTKDQPAEHYLPHITAGGWVNSTLKRRVHLKLLFISFSTSSLFHFNG